MHEKILLLFIIINIPIVFFYNQLVKFININDIPDNIRKFQKKKVPLFGGILIYYNLFIFFFIDHFFNLNPYEYFLDTREYFVFFFGILGFFIIGLYDDKYNLSAKNKLIFNSFLIFFLILIDETLVINNLHFSFFSNPIELRNFSYPFTVLSILLFINALNMFDGINLQSGMYCILIFTFLLTKEFYIFANLILILSLVLFLIFNYMNRAYLGDAGTQVLAFIISYILIKSHNSSNNIAPDEIFIILSLPGIDMFRLFLFRIIRGKHPFKADRNHIHHLILDKLGLILAFSLIQVVIIVNFLLYYFLQNKILSIFFVVLLYFSLLLIFKRK
ncbi:undecaprenyl/decaprenyl-phosphate alpha-N-acetylglucosaminyl 1-phosphate transferase [Candidatus Pelagibacter ubique]|nr:undecaprenyl/decaprenyl-phosphate alpha-N-acetylglucosaminyl 1-phosphate transferase [Candidatus Pelagibacter ubique]